MRPPASNNPCSPRFNAMGRMAWIALALALTLTGCNGDIWGPLCFAFCTDSTHVQRQYVDNRDQCRYLAELKTENMPPEKNPDTDPSISGGAADKTNKVRMVGTFSECMNSTAWAVPGPAGEEKKAEAAAANTQPGGLAPPPPAPASVQDAQRRRAAECAFARQSADASIIAKKRAEACDLECTQQLELAPGAPKPAACP